MNNYISRCKDVIWDYLSKAQHTENKIAEGHRIYQPDSMEQEEKRLRGELAKARKAAEEKIESIYHEASAGAREWGQLDGAKLTADAELLKGQGVTPEQFDALVTKYQDNYTMLDQLRKYGEARNAETIKKAHEAGNHDFYLGEYNVRGIPTPDAKMQEWDTMRQRAEYFLDVADGRGMDQFTWTMAKGTADKAIEEWGKEPEAPSPIDAQETFRKAWGFTKE